MMRVALGALEKCRKNCMDAQQSFAEKTDDLAMQHQLASFQKTIPVPIIYQLCFL